MHARFEVQSTRLTHAEADKDRNKLPGFGCTVCDVVLPV
jgi:hypothetical protein